MKTEEKLERMKALIQAAKDAGLCYTQRQFAQIIGIREATLSSALNKSDRFLSDKLLFTTESKLREKGVVLKDSTNSGNIIVGENNFFTQDEPVPEPAVNSKKEKAKKEDHVDRALDMLQTELDRKNTLVDRLVTLLEKKG